MSTPIILLLLASLFLGSTVSKPLLAFWILVIVLGVEAFARGYFLAFLGRAVLLLLVVDLIVAFYGNWQIVLACTFALLAIIVLIVNIRNARSR